MRAIKLLVVSIALAAVGAVWSQVPSDKKAPDVKAPADEKAAPAKEALDQLLAEALRNSPEIQLGEAKLREAEAELRRVRLSVLQKVIEQQTTVEAQKQRATIAEASYQRAANMFAKGGMSSEELARAKAEVESVKAAIKQAELTLNGLTGKLPFSVPGGGAMGMMGGGAMGMGFDPRMMGGQFGIGGGGFGQFGGGALGIAGGQGGVEDPNARHVRTPRGASADKVRQSLDKMVKIDLPVTMPLKDIPRWLRESVCDVPLLPQFQDKREELVVFGLSGEITLGAAFQALQDVVPGLQCFVREYGILITVDGVGPDDGMLLLDFWRNESPKLRSAPME